MFKSVFLALALFVAMVAAQNNCGPPQCYPALTCTQSKPIVDLVFMIDVSGSMQPPITGVKNGLTTFVQNLSTNISPTFSLVIFGANQGSGAPFLDLNAVTSSSTFITRMSYWASNTGGGVEPGLETFLTAMNIARSGNLGINFNTGQNNKKVFIVVTNEDSDPPVHSANIFSSNGYSENQNWLNDHCHQAGQTNSPCSFDNIVSATQIPAATWTNAWQLEVNAVANSMISADANVYMFVAGSASIGCSKDVVVTQTCNTHYQYCNPDGQTQSSDYSNFDATATMSTMSSAGESGCLQYQMLAAGKIMRCFDVYSTSNSNLINNFFAQIVSDVSKCQTDCYDYLCSGTTCLPPVYQCGCDGVKYSGKVSDGHGGCCLPSQMDCAGYCAGTHSYDACGVCILTGSSDSYCQVDCGGNHYLTSPPPGLTYITNIDVAGYLLTNSDILNSYVSTWKKVASVQQQYHDTGMFQGRTHCTFDLTFYNSKYGTSFNLTGAEADWLASLLTNSPKTAQCVAGSRTYFPPLPTDHCGQCITNADNPPYCVQDCSGTYRTNPSQASFVDHCGHCVAAGSDPDAHKDDCGVCDGNDASKNQCGTCGGSKAIDSCGNPVCQNITCNQDCDGVFRTPLTHHRDECNTCVSNSVVRSPICVKDCAGTWYNNTSTAPHHTDECGNCVLANVTRASTCVQDCNHVWNGTAYIDSCGQCVVGGVPPHQCLIDCAGDFYTSVQTPPHTIDSCGICNTPANQNSLFDHCGICTNKPGYNSTADCTPDCKGVWSLTTSTGRAFTDACGDCWYANQGNLANSNMDSCGTCWPGGSSNPNWNSGFGTVDSNGFPCKCGVSPRTCSDGSTTCTDQCPVYCNGTTNVKPDACGLCPGDPNYQHGTDKCGVCCDPNATPNLCNTEIDSCGVCFGYDKWKQNPCKICDQWYAYGNGTCKVDCKGVPGGTAKVGCDGICGSTAVCAVCGDGKLEGSETCDLGSDSKGKSKNVPGSGCNKCQTENGALGAAIGGAIGGVAAIIALGVAAFFALRYAQKNGLIGSANKQVDFGASNSNPLYKSEVSVHQNPLYES